MRSIPCLCLCLTTPFLAAQDPWAAVDEMVGRKCPPDTFGLVLVQPPGGPLPFEPRLLNDLWLIVPPKDARGALPPPLRELGWALYAPGGKRLGEGPGRPGTAQLRALMEKAGWQPLQEQLRTYLREHPGDGEAWAGLVEDLIMEAFQAREPGVKGPRPSEALRSDLAWALEGFHGVWSRSPRFLVSSFAFIQPLKPREDPVLSRAWETLTEVAAEQFALDPARYDLLHWALDRTGEALQEHPLYQAAMAVEPPPGIPWPPPSYAWMVRIRHEDDPAALAKRTRDILNALLAPEWVARLGREHAWSTLSTWGHLWVWGLIRKGDREGALEAIAHLRAQAGQGWKEVARQVTEWCLLKTDTMTEDLWGRLIPLGPKDRAALQRALAEPPLPDPAVERIPPLRAAVLGPADPLAWARIQIDPRLKAWAPGELVWTPLGPAEAQALAATLGEGPRWVILRGDRMLATGARLDAEDLAAALRSQEVPRLEALDTFIRAHPERLDARRARLDEIRPRLPDPDLEGRFLEDALATRSSLNGLGFEPKGEAWRRAATLQCARLAEDLSHWSSSFSLWGAYVHGSALDPGAPRPADLLRDLPTWPYRNHARMPGPIWEPAVLDAVDALAAANRHGELDAFMEVVWDRGFKTFLETQAKATEGNPGDVRTRFGSRLDPVRPWLRAWGKALRALPDPRRLKEIQSRLELIQPGLPELLAAGKP